MYTVQYYCNFPKPLRKDSILYILQHPWGRQWEQYCKFKGQCDELSPLKKIPTLCLSSWGEGCTREMTRDVTLVISLMTVGWASTYQPLEFCQRLAAEQPLPGQAVRTVLSGFHHGTNNSYLDTLPQLIWAGRLSASALYLSSSLLSVQCTVCTVYAWACTDVRRARTETSFVMRVKPIEKYEKLRNCGLNQQLQPSPQ
jgi:hypothetical protein